MRDSSRVRHGSYQQERVPGVSREATSQRRLHSMPATDGCMGCTLTCVRCKGNAAATHTSNGWVQRMDTGDGPKKTGWVNVAFADRSRPHCASSHGCFLHTRNHGRAHNIRQNATELHCNEDAPWPEGCSGHQAETLTPAAGHNSRVAKTTHCRSPSDH
jgi:hypothetical protein